MNERIKELAEQALLETTTIPLGGVYRPEGYLPAVSKVFADRFAELIVRECAVMTRNLCPHGELAEKAIKEYFGIEE